jgi:tape measure domain-containing protein
VATESRINLIVNASNAIRPLQRTNDITRKLAGNNRRLKGRIDRTNKSLRATGAAAAVASGGLNAVAGAARNLLLGFGLFKTAEFVLFNTAKLETQRKSLEVLTGSLKTTNKIISQLQAFGAVTPFKTQDLIETTKRLKAFGFTNDELVDTVKRLSDVAGATGADLDGITTAFGQIRAKGKLQQEENLQLLERGVDITGELKRITGLQGLEFEAAQRKGKISADLVNQALINLTSTGGQYAGGAIAQSTTLAGKFSTLQDNIEKLAIVIGETLTPALMGALDAANKVLGGINRLFSSEFQREISGLRSNLLTPFDTNNDLKKIDTFVKNIQPLGLDVDAIDLRVSQLQGTLKNIKDVGNQINKTRFGGTTLEEQNLMISTRETIQAKINDLLARREILTKVNISDNDKLNKLLLDGVDTLSEHEKLYQGIVTTLADGVTNGIIAAIDGTKKLGEVARGILMDIRNQLIRFGVMSIFKSFGFDFLKFADGGRPPVGRPSIVGERGPELFVPDRSGTIVPNHALGGSTNVVVNVDAGGTSVAGDNNEAEQLGRLISIAVQSEIVNQKRPGGLLA